MQRIEDIMTRDVECADPGQTLREAAERLKSRDIGSMPVCEGRRVVGIITDRDITIRAVAEGKDVETTRVSEIMSKDVIACRTHDTVDDAQKIMHDRQIRRLPVVDDQGELRGYLALARIARSEDEREAGKVIKGISASQPPKPMETEEGADKTRGRGRRKTG